MNWQNLQIKMQSWWSKSILTYIYVIIQIIPFSVSEGEILRSCHPSTASYTNLSTNQPHVQFQEETYIACVLEDESRETTSPSPAAAGERVHRCSSCAYTSTYRGNVIRHARLVHAIDEPDEEPPTIPIIAPTTPTIDIKKEPEVEAEETPNYCKSCDISFKFAKTYMAHKQFYCTANNQEAVGNNNMPAPPARVTDAPVLWRI